MKTKILNLSQGKYFDILIALVPFLLVVTIGISTVDFGYHWDENNHTIGVAKEFVLKETLIPSQYIYPSMGSYLALSGTFPYLIPLLIDKGFDWPAIQGFLINSVFNNNPSYNLNVRKIFVTISALSTIWIYFYKREIGRQWGEGLLAAFLLGLSWEVSYHLRWIANDGLVMQWGILTVLLSTFAFRRPEKRNKWLYLAAVTAGMATSTKYPAGLLILPVITAAMITGGYNFKTNLKQSVTELSKLALVFAASYLIITPGTVLDSATFLRDLSIGSGVYSSGHGQQTVQAGLPHLYLIGTYLWRVALSPYQLIALLLFLPSVVGIYSLYKSSKKEAAIFLVLPAIYLLFFSTRSVLFVRNLLILMPFVVILSARGIVSIFDYLKSNWLKSIWIALVMAGLVVNLNWLIYSAGTIDDRGTDRFVNELADHIMENPKQTFLISEKIRSELEMKDGLSLPNVTNILSKEVDFVVVYFYESMTRPGHWPVNYPGRAPEWFGLLEINMDYYASWQGDDRILLMPIEQAYELDILLLDE